MPILGAEITEEMHILFLCKELIYVVVTMCIIEQTISWSVNID